MPARLAAFARDGFIKVPQAFHGETLRACVARINEELIHRGVDPERPATWQQPVVRFFTPEGDAFAAAGSAPRLWSLYDQLLGPGNWVRRLAVGGTVAARFPHSADPGDAGWHIDGSYDVDGRYYVNVFSRARGLLCLFLFSDVGSADAPTEIAVGSHLDLPELLAPYGTDGVFFGDLDLADIVSRRPRVFATGNAGDVYVCHPFLVHRATWPHRGGTPRLLAQPEVGQQVPFALQPGKPRCLVESLILDGLSG